MSYLCTTMFLFSVLDQTHANNMDISFFTLSCICFSLVIALGHSAKFELFILY